MSHIAIVGLGYVGLPLALQKLVPVSSCRVAEATKLLENIFRSVNIALVNELKVVYGAMDVDIWEVIELAGEINTAMPDHVVKVCFEALNNDGKAIKGSKILLLGLAYKANVDDDRESPTYKLIEKFEALGGEVFYHDPHVPVIPMTREHAAYAGRKSVAVIADEYDLIVLSTGHDGYKNQDFSGYRCPVVDTRNAVPPANRPVKYHKA